LPQPEKSKPITRTRDLKKAPSPETATRQAGARSGTEKPAQGRPTEFRVLTKKAADLEVRTGELEQQLKSSQANLIKSEAAAAASERRAQEQSSVASRVAPLEQEIAALRPQLEEARRRLKDLQLELKRIRDDRDRLKGEAAEASERAAGLEARAQEGLAQMARSTALKLEASSFRLRLDAAQAELRKAQEELRAQADASAKVQADAKAHLAARNEAAAKIDAARKQEALARAEAATQAAAKVDAAEKAAEVSRRELEEVRKKLGELSEEVLRLREERDRADSDNVRQREQAADAREKLDQATEQIAGSKELLQLMERDLAQAKESEAAAREEAARIATKASATEERLRGEVARLEAARAEQQKSLDALGEKAKALERRLAEAQARKPEPPPKAPEPPPAPVAVASPAPEPPAPAAPPKVSDSIAPAQPVPAPASSPETTLRPANFFGPVGEDGQQIYMLNQLLTKDALGVIYAATERATGRKFMVEFMAGQAGEEQTQAIERGMEKLVALPHPNILHVQGTGRRKNRLYVMMDFVEAPTLGQAKIQEVRRLCEILRDAAGAIHYANEEGIFHGGVSPDTILVAKDGEKDLALVKEFGLGFLQELSLPATPGKEAPPVFRNPAYLPPEQVRALKSPLGAAVDVYGLGATLYGVLAGRPPFEGKDAAQISKRVMMEEPLPLEKVRKDVPQAVGAIIRHAMAKERGLRYATVQEMADALTKFLESSKA
jgi:hypothetical protein